MNVTSSEEINSQALQPQETSPTSQETSQNIQEESEHQPPTEQAEAPETTPQQTKKRIRIKFRDEGLTLSPDLAKSGKRQRKVNPLFTGYSIDKVFLSVI